MDLASLGATIVFVSLGAGSAAPVHDGATPLTTRLIAAELWSPTFLTHAPNDQDRLFVVQVSGAVRIIKNGVLLPAPFLDISSQVQAGGEDGLLGLAFHPEYETNGWFYVNYTAPGSGRFPLVTRIERYHVSADPDIADPSSAALVMRLDQPTQFHKAGWIGFGPDGYLYIPLGDGGVDESAQNMNSLLGKVLRIDVNGDDFPRDPSRNYAVPPTNPFVAAPGRDEIWASGLRNPWRTSFDRQTGDLWIADVGRNDREEINVQPASSAGGENYGWDCMEGLICGPGTKCKCDDPMFTLPIHDYTHQVGCAVMGGFVYRGCAIPDLRGSYFFADGCTGKIWSLRLQAGRVVDLQERQGELAPGGDLSILAPVSFGEDALGELYICDFDGGEIYKIVPATAMSDVNHNGIPDACEHFNPFDLNGDDVVNVLDLGMLLSSWSTPRSASGCSQARPCPADFNSDGAVDAIDLELLLSSWTL